MTSWQEHTALCRWAHRSICEHIKAHTPWVRTHTHTPSIAGSDPTAHRQPQTPAHTFNQRHICCTTASDVMSTLQALPNPAAQGSGGEECDWDHWASLERLLWVAGNTSLLPAQEILSRGTQNSSMMRDAWNYGYVASPSSPTQYKAQQALNYWACVMTCIVCSSHCLHY